MVTGRLPRIPPALANRLRKLAAQYETPAFSADDPIGCLRDAPPEELETAAFLAASLSYGNRTQFIPKIRWILDLAGSGGTRDWILSGHYARTFHPVDCHSFYRLFSCAQMRVFLDKLRTILHRHGTLGACLRAAGATDGPSALRAICAAFGGRAAPIVPRDTTSACKRLCMFLRWMARAGSPVDFGIWSGWLDKATLVIPLDVHVLRQANRLGLIRSRCATMKTAEKLTQQLSAVFPGDPCKGDFALYGLGIADSPVAAPTLPPELPPQAPPPTSLPTPLRAPPPPVPHCRTDSGSSRRP